MNVAILGTRGIPASYSGFETAVEQITSRLTARGHRVTVYCRPHVVDPDIRDWKGAELVHLPTVRNKYLDTFVHTLLSSLHAARRVKPDVALFFIAGNSPLCLVTRLAGIPTVINVDGPDSDRRKWNRVAKSYLRAAERLSPRMATRAITDSHAVAAHLRAPLRPRDRRGALRRRAAQRARQRRAGAPRPRAAALRALRGPPGAREQPAPAGGGLVADPQQRTKGMKLVVVGGAPYASEYINRVRRAADPRVVFPGYVFGPGYWELQRNAYLFCAPDRGRRHAPRDPRVAGGGQLRAGERLPAQRRDGGRRRACTSPGTEGVPDLARQLERLLADPELVAGYREQALERAELYSWDAVAAAYEQLLLEVSDSGGHGPLPMERLEELERAAAPARPAAVARR